jgi:hypothetical protein
MTQEATIKFLREHGMDVDNMSYNEINCIISIADKVAEESFKECLLTFCKCDYSNANHIKE